MMDKLISRRDAINAVSEITTTMSVCTNKDECYGMKRMQKQAITELENMPSAEQEGPDINAGNMDTTTHDSIPAETGKNDDDRTSGDCISRQAVKDIFTELYGISAIGSVFDKYEWADICETTANELPSAQPDIIRCKDCKHWNPRLKTANGNGLGSCDFHNVALVTSEGFCYWAERGEQNG